MLCRGARDAFCKVWTMEGYNNFNASQMVRDFSLGEYTARLLRVLDSVREARVSEKLSLAFSRQRYLLLGGMKELDSTVKYRGATTLQYACRTCGEAFEESIDRSSSEGLELKLRQHVHKHYPNIDTLPGLRWILSKRGCFHFFLIV